jgi:hypothetical protein
MLNGTILIMALLTANSPEEAIQDTWNAIQDGSPALFMSTLTPLCSQNISEICDEYLETLRTLSHEELGEVFASFRLEAAPGEIAFWDGTAVLEMLLSSPGQHQTVNASTISIDSVHIADSTAKVCLTLTIPGKSPLIMELPTAASPLGWHTSGLESITQTLLNTAITPGSGN